jgi:hypothetical protein
MNTSALQVELQQIFTERKKYGDMFELPNISKSDSANIKAIHDQCRELDYPADQECMAGLLDRLSGYLWESPYRIA